MRFLELLRDDYGYPIWVQCKNCNGTGFSQNQDSHNAENLKCVECLGLGLRFSRNPRYKRNDYVQQCSELTATPTLTPQPSQVTINPEERERG